VASIVENTPTSIQFANIENAGKSAAALVVQAGDWDAGDHVESGIVFDVVGEQLPLLAPADARKLAKWLARAADIVDGVKHSDKKNKDRRHYEQDDEDIDSYRR
jgi:hypothetical protein